MGHELKEGIYNTRTLTNDEMWKTVNWLFSSYSVNETSYKFLFFKSLIDCFILRDETEKLCFDVIFRRFTEISWNLILKYEIRQKAITVDNKECILERILHDYLATSHKNEYLEWIEVGEREQELIYKKVKIACKKYVVGALYSDMNELLYSFNKREEWVQLNPIMVDFICLNKETIENLNYYKWAKFYSKINDKSNEEKLEFLIQNGFARKNESLYRAVLAYEFERAIDNKLDSLHANTIEMLFEAGKCTTDNEKTVTAIGYDYENELFDSYEKMREYLKDPVLLINIMKKKKPYVRV